MKGFRAARIIACLLLVQAAPVLAAKPGPKATSEFSFGVVANVFRAGGGEPELAKALSDTDDEDLAFLVATGIKGADEPCTDAIYGQRKEVLNAAKNGLVVSIAGSDWVGCRNGSGRSAAFERLNRLRELFHSDDLSLGASRIPLRRQSITPKFRAYAENARWEFGRVMFATINLPAENNHYLPDAGRNSEFEDRMIANQEWLQKLFLSAAHRDFAGIVLFCDGNPLALPQRQSARSRRDGFAEVRRRIVELAARFPGKVLIVHGGASPGPGQAAIAWRNNLGVLGPDPGWSRIIVDPGSAALFSVAPRLPVTGNGRP